MGILASHKFRKRYHYLLSNFLDQYPTSYQSSPRNFILCLCMKTQILETTIQAGGWLTLQPPRGLPLTSKIVWC